MRVILASVLPALLFVGGIYAATLAATIWRGRRRSRRNPLTITLLRAPGESLRTKIDALNVDISIYAFLCGTVPFGMLSLHLIQSHMISMSETSFRIAANTIVAVLALVYCIRKLILLLQEREWLLLGYDAERATGQELTKLERGGFHVFHDVPANNFNLDHVVVGANGVFVVESKGRSKSSEKEGVAGVTVQYDGTCLRFPGWTETAPIKQVEAAAAWLSKELSRETGEAIRAQPVLSIVGWNVDRRERKGGPLVYNGRNPDKLFTVCKQQDLSDSTMRTICNRLEEWVGDVQPTAYRQPTEQVN